MDAGLWQSGDNMPKVNLNKSVELRDREKVLYDRYGGFMSVANIMKELGVSRNTALKFVSRLPSHSPTGVKRYDIQTVAKAIEATRAGALK